MKKLLLIIPALVFQYISLNAEMYQLDLDKSIDIAKEKSYNMQNLIQEFRIAEYNLKAATSRLKTHIDLTLTSPEYSQNVYDYRTDTSITYYSSKILNYGGNLTVNQPLPSAGSIYLSSGLSNTDYFTLNKRSPELFTQIGFTQPLTALYGYNSVKSDLKLAELAYESSKKGLKREELNIVYNVSNSFYRLLAYQKSTEIARMDYDRQKEAYDISQQKYKAGLIREVDALQMEVDLADAQNNYDLAVVQQGSAMNEFKQLIGVNLNDSVALSSDFQFETVIVDPEKAVRLALDNRLEIREQEIQIEQNKLSVKRQKSEGMIQSSLDVSFGKKGVSYQDIHSNLANSIENSYTDFKKRDPNFGVGLTVKIPILDFGENRAKVRAAEARQKQSTLRKEEVERQIEREVRNLVADLNSSLKRLQLLEKNIVVAEKSFEITRQRYSDGDVDSQGLALERKRLNTAYTTHLSAYINYQLLLADLMRKTFYDFKKNVLIS